MPGTRPPNSRPAFTLIELVVVIVILGVVAAVIVPRFVAGPGRAAEVSALALRDLVSAVATRSVLAGRRVAISFDASSGAAEALAWRNPGPVTDWTAAPVWAADPLTPPAALEGATITSVRCDALPLDPARWRIDFDPGQRRPAVSITVSQADGPKAWRIDLPSGAMRAEIAGAGAGPAPLSTVIDLDALGRTEEAW